MKPKWTPRGSLLYAQSGLPIATESANEWQDIRLVAGEGRDVVESVLKGADKDVSQIFQTSIIALFLDPRRSLKMILKWGRPFLPPFSFLSSQTCMSVNEANATTAIS
jgi:hypothetical protein